MAINYTYLDPDSPFTADVLNTRFDASMGTLQGVNSLLPEDMSVGTFRHNHIPRLIHQDGMTLAELTEETSSVFGDSNRFSVMVNSAFTDTGSATSPDLPVLRLTWTEAIKVSMDLGASSDNVGAIIVLANICVTKIARVDAEGAAAYAQEDRDYAQFVVRITDSAGVAVDLDKTRRTVSPRVTIDYGLVTDPPCAPLITSGTVRENATNQDVAIRTVITPDDLTSGGLADVDTIEVYAEYTSVFTTTRTGKGNLTAIPIHTKLVSS
jgi:hypothetical protein